MSAQKPDKIRHNPEHPQDAANSSKPFDVVQEADEESFPCSDPPAWTSGKTHHDRHLDQYNQKQPKPKPHGIRHFFLSIKRFFGK